MQKRQRPECFVRLFIKSPALPALSGHKRELISLAHMKQTQKSESTEALQTYPLKSQQQEKKSNDEQEYPKRNRKVWEVCGRKASLAAISSV